MRLFRQLWWQADAVRQFVDCHAGIHALARPVDDMANGVAIVGQGVTDDVGTEQRFGVTRAEHLGIEPHQQIHRIGPGIEVAIGGPADGIEIREGTVEIVAREQNPLLRVPDNHVIRCFAGGHDKFKIDTGQTNGCSLFGHQARRRHHAGAHALKRTIAGPDPDPDDFIRIGKADPELALGAGLHGPRGARVRRLFDQRVFRPLVAGDDLRRVVFGKDRCARDMVAVGVGQNDRLYRKTGDFAEFSQNIRRRRRGLGGVDDDKAVIADNHVDIRRRKAERHIDIVGKPDDVLPEIRRMRFQFGMHVSASFAGSDRAAVISSTSQA